MQYLKSKYVQDSQDHVQNSKHVQECFPQEITSHREKLKEWLTDAAIPLKDVQLQGQLVGKAFTLQFKGAPQLAADRVKQTHQLLHRDGVWREFYCTSPAKKRVRLFIDMDKSLKKASA